MDSERPKSSPRDAMLVGPLPPARRGRRLFFFFTSAVLLTLGVSWLFADLLWRTGWSASRTILLLLFSVLFFQIALGCVHGLVGFWARWREDPARITALAEFRSRDISGTSTALVFPIHNEDMARVCAGVRATYESLARTGEIGRFDFFILSDSTDPDRWIEEETRWFDLIRELDALGRIYYRRRLSNEGKKCGNVRDFLASWGRRYRYFIVCDADSVMRGETIVALVRLMETHPAVGMIQTVPAVVNAESLFGRIHQFANRLYAPLFIAGLNYWAQGFGNYWGHNAIIRTDAFMQCCDLPQLPGRKPFGGYILSHDFVEAALMLREHWQVWFAHDLEGSYEETPQDLIENARRDRRWCQGNLQHALVLFAKGLRGVSRIHLALGILGYLTGPLWLAFLLTFDWMRWSHRLSGLSDITVRAFTPFLNVDATRHALLIFCICMSVLFLPKVLAFVELLRDRERRRAFGGAGRALASVVGETIFSALHAPLQMLWHSLFVVSILAGRTVGWKPQRRSADGTSWADALRAHGWQTLVGLSWGALAYELDRATFWWFVPVLLGMVLAVPLSVWSSRKSCGRWAARAGLFLTPEEIVPPPELQAVRETARNGVATPWPESFRPHGGMTLAVLDPYLNALHVSLLREMRLNPVYAEALDRQETLRPPTGELAERLLAQGPEALDASDRMRVLCSADTMARLHRAVWARPESVLSRWWVDALGEFARWLEHESHTGRKRQFGPS